MSPRYLLSQGPTAGESSRKLSVTKQTYYRWRREYGGMRVEQVKRPEGLEKENARLKRLAFSVDRTTAGYRGQNKTTTLIPVAPHQQAVTTNIKR